MLCPGDREGGNCSDLSWNGYCFRCVTNILDIVLTFYRPKLKEMISKSSYLPEVLCEICVEYIDLPIFIPKTFQDLEKIGREWCHVSASERFHPGP